TFASRRGRPWSVSAARTMAPLPTPPPPSARKPSASGASGGKANELSASLRPDPCVPADAHALGPAIAATDCGPCFPQAARRFQGGRGQQGGVREAVKAKLVERPCPLAVPVAIGPLGVVDPVQQVAGGAGRVGSDGDTAGSCGAELQVTPALGEVHVDGS